MKIEKFVMGLLVGLLLGAMSMAIIVNTIAKPSRERNIYSQGVRDGIEGEFSIKITKQEVLWHIVPIEHN